MMERPSSVPIAARSRVNGSSTENGETVQVEEIRDLPEYNPPQPLTTSAVLSYCQRKMILPYTRLLGLLGLRPLLGGFSDQSITSNAINKVHLFFVTCFLVFGYVLQLFTCYRRDQGFSYVEVATDQNGNTSVIDLLSNSTVTECQGNLFLCYILPSLLHMCAFIHTIYLLRVAESEHLQTLFEKVFLLTSRTRGALTQQVLLFRLRAHVILSVIWLLLALIIQLFIVLTTTSRMATYLPTMSHTVQNCLIGLMIVSTFCQDVVHCLVVSNYCIECHLLMTYVLSISERVIEKSLVLDVAMKELLEYEKFLGYLNQQVSSATCILFVLSTTRALVAGSIIFQSRFLLQDINTDWLIVVMLLVQWASISTAPLVSAALVTYANRTVSLLGQKIRVRPFGYQETPSEQLDSFMIFTASYRGSAKLCFFPISGALLGVISVVAVLTFFTYVNLP